MFAVKIRNINKGKVGLLKLGRMSSVFHAADAGFIILVKATIFLRSNPRGVFSVSNKKIIAYEKPVLFIFFRLCNECFTPLSSVID